MAEVRIRETMTADDLWKILVPQPFLGELLPLFAFAHHSLLLSTLLPLQSSQPFLNPSLTSHYFVFLVFLISAN